MKISCSIDINSPVEKVWEWLGTPEKAMVWQTGVAGGEILNETPDMVGTTFRETVEEDGRSTEMRGEITAYTVNRELAMHLEGDYNVVDVEWRLEEFEERTHLDFKADVRFKAIVGVMSFLLRPVFRKKVTEQLRRELDALKKLCEQSY
jgi:hypothetical protein